MAASALRTAPDGAARDGIGSTWAVRARLDAEGGDGRTRDARQRCTADDGGAPWRNGGGMFGTGLVENVREAYRFLVFNYDPGDEIFVFGFSRGAFSARTFVGSCGT